MIESYSHKIAHLTTLMKDRKSTSLLLAAATVLGIGLIATDADAQSRRGSGHGGGYENNYGGSRGGHKHHRVDHMRNDIYSVDRLANQMLMQFANEMRYQGGGRHSAVLMHQMRHYKGQTSQLVQAYNGSCQVAVDDAARRVRESLTNIEHQATRVHNLSRSVKHMIDQSCPLTTQIVTGAKRFSPQSAPVYADVPRSNRPVNSHRQPAQSGLPPYASILSSIFRASLNR